MGLIIDYFQPQYEVIIPNCYWKVDAENGIRGSKTKLNVSLVCYKDKLTADTNRNKYSGFELEFVPDLNSADNFITQAYNYAKTLPEFINAVDA